MKKVFIYVIFLLLSTILALIINEGANYALVMLSPSSTTYKPYRLFKQSPCDEIQIFGSSRAVLHFVPSMFTQKCFNYGVRGCTMSETLLHLKHAATIDSELPIIVNIDAWGFPRNDMSEFRGDYKLVLNHPLVRTVLPDELKDFSNRCIGIRFYGELRTNIANFLYTRETNSKTLDNGAVLEKVHPTEREWAVIIRETLPKESVSFYCNDIYQKILNEIYATTSRPIIWVVGPYASPWKTMFEGNKDLELFLMKQSGHPNVYTYDFYSKLDYPNSLFKDLTHLNEKGADQFTQEFITTMRKNPALVKYFK